jgi:sulfur-carrier protein
VKLVYFARIREQIGLAEERLDPPPEVTSIAELIGWLRTRGDTYAAALEHDETIRVAIDHELVEDRATPLAGAGEIALFPPMTGG